MRKLALTPDLDQTCRFQFLYVVRKRRRRDPERSQSVGTAQRALRAGDAFQQFEPPRIGDGLENDAAARTSKTNGLVRGLAFRSGNGHGAILPFDRF